MTDEWPDQVEWIDGLPPPKVYDEWFDEAEETEPELFAPGWKWSFHAKERVGQRVVSWTEAIETLLRPHIVIPGKSPGTEDRRRGALKVVVNPTTMEVITVAWTDGREA